MHQNARLVCSFGGLIIELINGGCGAEQPSCTGNIGGTVD